MAKIITKKWLEAKGCCSEKTNWFESQSEKDGLKLVKKLIREDKSNWANWLLPRIMRPKHHESYAKYIYDCAEPFSENQNSVYETVLIVKACMIPFCTNNKKKYKAFTAVVGEIAMQAASINCRTGTPIYAGSVARFYNTYLKTLLKILNYGIKLLEEK